MVVSMTGYGRSVKASEDLKVTVEIKTVNHRFCEFHVRMPKSLFMYEDRIKKVVGEYIQRGKADVFVSVEGNGFVKRSLHVDWDLLDSYHRMYEKMNEAYKTSQTFPLDRLLLTDEIVHVDESDDISETVTSLLIDACHEAASALRSMREKEGKALYNDIYERLNNIAFCSQEIAQYAPQVQERYRERLQKRVDEFLSGQDIEIDEGRLMTEVAVFADKSNIEEELTRLQSHVNQAKRVLADEEGAVGRKLDFIVQELNRECNTIGSKANDIHIGQRVVELKSEVEKVKEQVQNIE
ncbi:YicC/YloC family endoribonuclease [Texcoconibacillus texcoconensis]|uniref:Uncharacterized protein (TIGR00255 family) n=1 Tax=Texcoconibacillus texcoconensis TaxID=1095777 RepID=A0A840QL97_9BACI|nr:YicC/YloC family endoribonuclease [Texcoconibacillus texcoconensis]MBB5172137.1 uncharacterized protein (TIGR00255 family) [Texcoconibacillus texcoconensis]